MSSMTSRRASIPFEDFDRRRRTRGREKGAHHFAPGAVAAAMSDPPPAVGGLEAEREAAVSRAVETDAESRELFDRRGRGLSQALDDRAVAEPVAGGDRVGRMERRRVVRPQRRRQAALRPKRRALRAKRPLRDQDERAGRKLKRRHQPRDASADDDDAPAQRDRFDGHSASIRSTARRAGAAITGSIVTSPSIVSSAWRILARVIRFMCGQRAQGLTNSTSG